MVSQGGVGGDERMRILTGLDEDLHDGQDITVEV